LVPDATQRMLTLQLRELEEDGIIVRKVYPVVPPKVEYTIAKRGGLSSRPRRSKALPDFLPSNFRNGFPMRL
jgi:DNA-binding HxlR family transcriptional regulator